MITAEMMSGLLWGFGANVNYGKAHIVTSNRNSVMGQTECGFWADVRREVPPDAEVCQRCLKATKKPAS